MPSIKENLNMWEKEYNWIEDGDEWSEPWGGTNYMWFGSIFPRIMKNLPCHSILEIACGHGRISQYLLKYCKELILLDLSNNCIEHCKKRFAKHKHIKYYVTDGLSMNMIEDNSIDFVFSWDSLVHAEKKVLKHYINELSKKLTKGGTGIIHHSNIGTYRNKSNKLLVYNSGWRAEDMTAKDFVIFCKDSNLICKTQEIFRWSSLAFSDCISYFYKSAQNDNNFTTKTYINKQFINEQWSINSISKLYGSIHSDNLIPEYYLSFENWKNYLIDISLKRDIYFWGIGKYFNNVLDYYLNEIGLCRISGLIDKFHRKKDLDKYNYKVYSPKEIFNKYNNYESKPFFIISSFTGEKEIEKLLLENDFIKGIDFLSSAYYF